MADIWDAYVKKFGTTPKDATQLQQFAKASANMKPLSFKEARDLFNAHKTKPVVTNGANKKPPINKPISSAQKYNIAPKKINTNTNNNNPEIERQIDECNMEINNLNTIEKDFSEHYNGQINDIENQLKNLYDAIKRREMDLKKWRKQEFDEGINKIKSTKQILNNRINDLNTNNNPNNIYNIPKLNDFYITRFTKHSLQIQNTLNNIFQIGETYQQNINNKQFISLKINKNPQNNINNIKMRNNNNNIQNNNNNNNNDKRALDFSASPFGKGKIIQNNNNINNKKKIKQNNGTKVLQYNTNDASGIRGFDIGNNAKYANAQQYAQNTNTLPSNFWEDESDSDSEQERQETTDEIVNRWKTQDSNIRNNNNRKPNNKTQNIKNNNNNSIKPIKHSRVRSMYDASSSEDEHNENENENDGFEKYIPPAPKPIDPIIAKQKQKEEEENYWKNNNTKWIIYSENKQFEYDSLWFGVPKMRNGKANGLQMKPFMQKSGLNNNILKQIWKLSDLDRDGKMGNEEFALCMYLMDKAKKGQKIPNKLPQNYIPPSFRGKRLIKTPPKKSKPLPNSKSEPPKMDLASAKSDGNKQKYNVKPKGNVEKKEEKKEEKQEKVKEDNGGKLEVKKDEKKEKVVKSEVSEDKNKGKGKGVDEVK